MFVAILTNTRLPFTGAWCRQAHRQFAALNHFRTKFPRTYLPALAGGVPLHGLAFHFDTLAQDAYIAADEVMDTVSSSENDRRRELPVR